MNCLIVGGAGFIGSHFVDELVKCDKNYVTVIDDLSSGDMDNLKNNFDRDNFQFIKMNAKAYSDLLEYGDYDSIFLFAAKA